MTTIRRKRKKSVRCESLVELACHAGIDANLQSTPYGRGEIERINYIITN